MTATPEDDAPRDPVTEDGTVDGTGVVASQDEPVEEPAAPADTQMQDEERLDPAKTHEPETGAPQDRAPDADNTQAQETAPETTPPLAAPPRLSAFVTLAPALTRVVDGLAQWRLVAVLLIGLFAALALAPGFTTIPPIDRDEPRFSQATRQMIETGDYLDIRFQDEARYKKPIGIYWLQAITLDLLDAPDPAPIWMYRIPSLIGAFLGGLLVYFAAIPFGSKRVAFMAALLVTGTILLGVEARLAKTDAVLFALTTLAMGVLARVFLFERDSEVPAWQAALFWTALALGILVKGPVILMVVGLTLAFMLVMTGEFGKLRRLRLLPGFLWATVLVLPWFVAIGVKTDGAFFIEAIGRDMLGKVGSGQENHWGPPGLYLFAFLPLTGWPLAPFGLLSLVQAFKARRERANLFLLSWLVPSWIIFEVVATKLPHYVLPLLPALAILAARAIEHGALSKGRLRAFLAPLLALVPVATGIGIPVLLLVFEGTVPPLGALLGLTAALLGLAAWRFLAHDAAKPAFLAATLSSLALSVGAFGFLLPAAETVWVTPRLVASLEGVTCQAPLLATTGYREPSLVLMTRTDLAMTTGEGAASFLSEGGCRVAFVEARQEEAFTAALADLTPRLVTRVEGFNINGGKRLDIGVYAIGE